MSLHDNILKRGIQKLNRYIAGESSMELRNSLVKIGDHEYRLYDAKEDVYLEMIGSEFEPSMVSVYKTLIRDHFYCLDIGANIGCTSLLFSQIAKQVDCFEPSPSTYKILKKNLQTARIKNVTPHNFGLGADNFEANLVFSPGNRSGGFVANQISGGSGHSVEKVKIKKLDDCYQQKKNVPINFIKIDVEGFEKSVIEGGKKTILSQKPVVILELNHWCLNAFQRITVPDFFDFLKSIFPMLYAISGDNHYADLYDKNDSFNVMYHHIINFNYCNLVGAFNESQLENFKSTLLKAV